VTPPLLLLGALLACAHRSTGTDIRGPRRSALDLYKPWPGADKLYVEVDLGDGKPRLMLLDSGAGTSLLTPQVAAELGLVLSEEVSQYVQVSGLLEARSSVLTELKIGRHRVPDVHVAVPLQAVHDRAGGVEIAGLLGANVLSRFQLWVDYPAQRLELLRPNSRPVPVSAAAMTFDGQHAMTAVVLVAQGPQGRIEEDLLVDIDTGARGLWLFGDLPTSLEQLGSAGLEPVVGVSSPGGQPTSALLKSTRRIPLVSVRAGGATIDRELDAIWSVPSAEADAPSLASPGLLGHSLLDGNRVLLDYDAQRFAILPPRRQRDELDVHDWRLRSLRHDRTPEAAIEQAEMRVWMGQLDEARRALERHSRRNPQDAEAVILLARLERNGGAVEDALQRLQRLSPNQLVQGGEIVATVNSLWLAGQPGAGLSLAQQATEDLPQEPAAWVALSDARRFSGDPSGARAALARAGELLGDPDSQLLRRAWVARDDGDQDAALAYLRRLLDREPSGLLTPWFYADIALAHGQATLAIVDLDRLRARLHDGQGALDFLAHAYVRLGQTELGQSLAAQGLARDCAQEEADAKANCEAWYRGVVGIELDTAETQARSALAAKPDRAAYLDTLGVVLEAKGQIDEARVAARRAAMLEPDDVYLLWQASRFDPPPAPPSP